jgi:hypothetical protein
VVDTAGGTVYPSIAGTAAPGDTVTVHLGSTTRVTTADISGNWSVSWKEWEGAISAGSTLPVVATAGQNPAPASGGSIRLAAPGIQSIPQGFSISGTPGAQVQITGAPGVGVVQLDGSGTYTGYLDTGSYTISARYWASPRYGPYSGATAVTVA